MSAWASLQFCTTDNNGLWQLEINRDIIQEFWRINLWNCPRSHSVPSRALYRIKYLNCRDLFWLEEFVGGIGVMLLNKFRRLCSLDILIWNHDLWSKEEDTSRSTSVLESFVVEVSESLPFFNWASARFAFCFLDFLAPTSFPNVWLARSIFYAA